MTAIKEETPRNASPPKLPRTLPHPQGRAIPKLFEISEFFYFIFFEILFYIFSIDLNKPR